MVKADVHGMRVGIFGGGQLARMLSQAGQRMGLQVRVQCAKLQEPTRPKEPAEQVTQDVHYGDLQEPVFLASLLQDLDLVTFESEFVPVEILKAGFEGLPLGKRPRVFPDLQIVDRLRNKIRQKHLLTSLGVPTSEFLVYPARSNATNLLAKDSNLKQTADEFVREAWQKFEGACVFKWAELGYDGYGTGLVDTLKEASDFVYDAIAKGRPLFCERRIRFQREVSQVAVRGLNGSLAFYPLVESIQRQGICHRVVGPASANGVSRKVELEAQQIARTLMEHIGYVGILAVEMFLTEDGEIFVNELAPRVHNTGHFTLDAGCASQFENHWRAGLGMQLGSTECFSNFGMLNLLGTPQHEALKRDRSLDQGPELTLNKNEHLHWYGKAEWRAGRKLGHVNVIADSTMSLLGIRDRLIAIENEWIQLGESP
jgi:5-(carboxyamino)imidazole ribonucleotide synthase